MKIVARHLAYRPPAIIELKGIYRRDNAPNLPAMLYLSSDLFAALRIIKRRKYYLLRWGLKRDPRARGRSFLGLRFRLSSREDGFGTGETIMYPQSVHL